MKSETNIIEYLIVFRLSTLRAHKVYQSGSARVVKYVIVILLEICYGFIIAERLEKVNVHHTFINDELLFILSRLLLHNLFHDVCAGCFKAFVFFHERKSADEQTFCL